MAGVGTQKVFEDDRVIVWHLDLEPGQLGERHTHELDYVITPVTACKMLLEEPGGASREVALAPGDSYRRDAGVAHNVINAGQAPMTFVEVELK